MSFIYEFFRWLAVLTCYPFQLLLFTKKLYYEDGGRRRIIRGGALIIANHYNVLDYMLDLYVVQPRRLNVVASEYAYRNKLITFGMRFFGGIQANRVTKDMSFMRKSADLIKKGELVLIFPEGQNTDDGTIKPFKQSYLAIAHRANAPIIPIVSDGNFKLFKRTRVIVGNPIYLSDLGISPERMTRFERADANEIVYIRFFFCDGSLSASRQRKRTKINAKSSKFTKRSEYL